MTAQTPNTVRVKTNCLGCQDCKGLCRAVIDLAFVPETILKRA